MKFIWISFLPFIVCQTLKDVLKLTWNGIKERNIDPYDIKLVHRPYSETPNDAVSEGVGYGLLLALYLDDQTYFNMILESAEQFMWNGQFYDWNVDMYGNKLNIGAATDAEQDIAFSLIMASRKVKKGEWKEHLNPSYIERYQLILNNMWNLKMISDTLNVAPGAGWGGIDFMNPGYCAPAWYRVFKEVDTLEHDWDSVIQHCYNTIKNNVGYKNGLLSDWTTVNGDYYDGNLGYNNYGRGKYLFKDAIRVYWRIGTDYLWFNSYESKEFLSNAFEFIRTKNDSMGCNFYTMGGELLPSEDIWIFDGGQRQRPRREHSHLTIGMWSIVPKVLNESNWIEYEKELLSYYESNKTYWGKTKDEINEEDIEHNEMYFDQFLASFGALILAEQWRLL